MKTVHKMIWEPETQTLHIKKLINAPNSDYNAMDDSLPLKGKIKLIGKCIKSQFLSL